MVTIDGVCNTVIYKIWGDKGEYLKHINAIITALGALNQDTEQHRIARETLADMLYAMMPSEDQLK